MRKVLSIFILLSLIIIVLLSSCSLLIDEYNRLVGYNSICWEDNDHILVYAKIIAWDNYSHIVGGEMKNSIWSGGEIWRIDVNTGDKELLMREKGPEYVIAHEYAVITLQDTFKFISDWDTTFLMDEHFNNWESYGAYTYPQISEDGKEIVYLQESYEVEDVYVKKLDLDTGNETILWQGTENIKTMDYDFDRNLLLLNNIRLVNLNTGLDTVLVEVGDEISGDTVYYTGYSKYGRFYKDNIITDIQVKNSVYSKVYIEIDSLENRRLKYGLRGIPSPDGTKFAFGVDNGVEIQNGHGSVITKLIFDSSGL